MKKFLLAILLLVNMLDISATGRKMKSGLDAGQVYAGVRIGAGIPLSLGRSADEISFKDVARVGFALKGDGMWMASSNIGVGAEFCFNTFPYNQPFWQTLQNRGSFEASYRDISFGLTGRLTGGSAVVKPFFGIGANAHMLTNKLDFTSNYMGTAQDETVRYTSRNVKPGFAAEAGIFFDMGKSSFVSICARMNIIPFLSKETMITQDKYTFQERIVVVNPHGNQNSFEAVVGLHFGVRKHVTKKH